VDNVKVTVKEVDWGDMGLDSSGWE